MPVNICSFASFFLLENIILKILSQLIFVGSYMHKCINVISSTSKWAWQDFFSFLFSWFEASRVQACDVEAEGAFREDDQGVVESVSSDQTQLFTVWYSNPLS